MASIVYDQDQIDCRVFTFREGMLSTIAHDLELRVTRLQVTVEAQADQPTQLDARFDLGSLRVVTALRDGAPLPDALSQGDREKIERTVRADVLRTAAHPEARAQGQLQPSGDGFSFTGTLTLAGRERPLTLRSAPSHGQQVAELTLHQPDYGIKPYVALLGALRVQANVKVRVAVPWPPRGL